MEEDNIVQEDNDSEGMNCLSHARELAQKEMKEHGITFEGIKEDIDRLFAELRGYKYETN